MGSYKAVRKILLFYLQKHSSSSNVMTTLFCHLHKNYKHSKSRSHQVKCFLWLQKFVMTYLKFWTKKAKAQRVVLLWPAIFYSLQTILFFLQIFNAYEKKKKISLNSCRHLQWLFPLFFIQRHAKTLLIKFFKNTPLLKAENKFFFISIQKQVKFSL